MATDNRDKILYNVKKVILKELDPTTWLQKDDGEVISIDCDSEVTLEPEINTGNQVILRDETRIHAEAKEEDLLTAILVTLTTVKLNEKSVAMIQGGEVLYSDVVGETDKIIGYKMPTQAEMVNQKKYFIMELYVTNYEGNEVIGYTKFVFPKCKGNGVVSLTFNKSNFFSPALPIIAKEIPSQNQPCYYWEYVDALPVIEAPATGGETEPSEPTPGP